MAIVYSKIGDYPYVTEVFHQFFKLLDQHNITLQHKIYSCGVDYKTKQPKRVLGFKYIKNEHFPFWKQAFDIVSQRHGVIHDFDIEISHRPYLITVRFLKVVNDLKSMGHLTDCKCLANYDKAYHDYMNGLNQPLVNVPLIQKCVDSDVVVKTNPTKTDYQITLDVINYLMCDKKLDFKTNRDLLEFLENEINPKITKRVIYVCCPTAEVSANEQIAVQKANDNELIEYVVLTLHPAYISLLNESDKHRFVLNKLALHNTNTLKQIDTSIEVFGDVGFVYGKSVTLDFMTQIALALKGKISIKFEFERV